jgi:hypothetical protein
MEKQTRLTACLATFQVVSTGKQGIEICTFNGSGTGIIENG